MAAVYLYNSLSLSHSPVFDSDLQTDYSVWTRPNVVQLHERHLWVPEVKWAPNGSRRLVKFLRIIPFGMIPDGNCLAVLSKLGIDGNACSCIYLDMF